MAREKIGTRDGQDFYVGSDAPAPTITPTATPPAPATTLPTNTTPDNRTLPGATDFGSFLSNLTTQLNGNTNATPAADPNTTTYTIPALVDQENARVAAQRNLINSQFGQQQTVLEDRGAHEVAGAGNSVGQFRGEGFSTAANSYIASVQKQSDDRLTQLNQAKETALANLDTTSAQNIQNLMTKELDRQDKLSELRFNQLTTLLGVGLNYKQLQDSEDKPQTQEVNGQLFQYDKTTGAWTPAAGTATAKTVTLNNILYQQQPDGTWKNVAGEGDHSAIYKEWQDYQSTGGKADFNTYQNMDANRKRTVINTGSAKDAKTSAALGQVAPAINAVRGGDGFISPQAYQDFYQTFVANNPGNGQDFLDNFPVTLYLSPGSRTLFAK